MTAGSTKEKDGGKVRNLFAEPVSESAEDTKSPGDEVKENDDARCVQRFLAGDDGGYEELVLRYQRRIFNLSLRYLNVESEAQEVTQEIFIKVYKNLKGFRGEAKFSTWLYQVAVNHCKNKLKYLKRRHYYTSDSMEQTMETDDGEIKHQYAASEPSPLEEATTHDVKERVRAAIEKLGPEQREAIVLRDLQGLSYEEVAEITGQALGTVKSRIHRARSELARILRPMLEAEGEL